MTDVTVEQTKFGYKVYTKARGLLNERGPCSYDVQPDRAEIIWRKDDSDSFCCWNKRQRPDGTWNYTMRISTTNEGAENLADLMTDEEIKQFEEDLIKYKEASI